MLKLLNYSGNPNVGVYARATDEHVFLPPMVSPKERLATEEALGVKAVMTSIGGTNLVGSLLAANKNAIAVADITFAREVAVLRSTGLKVTLLRDKLNALGNNLLVTDTGGLCNPEYSEKTIKRLSEVFGVPIQSGTFAGLGNVGMAGVATGQGVLVHPKSTPEEREVARRAFGREVMVGTINHGTGLIGAGLVANARGAVIGSASTNIEIGRIEEALGLLPVAPA